MSYRTEGEFSSVRGGQWLSKGRWGLEQGGWGLGRVSKGLGGWGLEGRDGRSFVRSLVRSFVRSLGRTEISPSVP